MNILKIILTVIYAIDCIALTVVVLMQEGKQQGLGSIAGVADTYWGKNKGRSMEGGLIRGTIIMGVIFFVLSIVLNIIWPAVYPVRMWEHSCCVSMQKEL